MNEVPLGSVAEILMGTAPPGETYNSVGEGLPMIAGAGDYGERYPETKQWTTAPSRIAEVGDLIICVRATIGDLNWADKRYCLGRGVGALRPHPGKLDISYLAHYMTVAKAKLERFGTGSTFPAIRRCHLEEFPIPLPPLAEQKRIAAVLDKADDLRGKRRQALATLDTLLQSVFLDMFGDPVTNPRGWPRKPLGELLSAIESGWSPVCEERPARADEWGVLKLGGVTWCEYDASENKALLPDVEPDRTLEVRACDLLMSRKNTFALVAASAFVFETRPRILLPDLVYRLVLKPGSGLEPEYLWQQVLHPGRRSQIQRLAGGSAGSMPNISKEKLRGVVVEVPPLDLQKRFKAIVWGQRRMRMAQEVSQREADTLFAALQSAAFAGTLFNGEMAKAAASKSARPTPRPAAV